MVTDGRVASTVGAGDASCDPSIVPSDYLAGDFVLPIFRHVCWGAEEHPEVFYYGIRGVDVSPFYQSGWEDVGPPERPDTQSEVLVNELTAPDAFSYMTNSARKGVSWSVLRRKRLRSSANDPAFRERQLFSSPPGSGTEIPSTSGDVLRSKIKL